MSEALTAARAPVDRDALAAHLEAGCTPRADWRIGVEHEKLVRSAASLAPLPYAGEPGMADVLEALTAHGWRSSLHHEGRPLALARGGASVSLEPGGQLEHAAAPQADLHAVAAALRAHAAELVDVCEALDVVLLAIGFEPVHGAAAMPWMPHERFAIMRRYMPRVGRHGCDMMQRTASIQVSLDYADEADLVRKFRAALALQPLVVALTASSPYRDGSASGYQSFRSHVWRETDEARCGIPSCVFEDGFGFERYVDWALSVPMYSIVRNGHHLDTAGLSFRDFLAGCLPGLPGAHPCLADWTVHLPTLSPEVRLKQVLELRGADSGPLPMVVAVAALWTGLLYDDDALGATLELVGGWSQDARETLARDAAVHGLAAPINGHDLRALARQLLALAHTALARRGILDAARRDETIHLVPLREVVERNGAPALGMLGEGGALEAARAAAAQGL
ncbi:MAG: glutamate--cysteine ligase [Gammaproteobacteria bacterium]